MKLIRYTILTLIVNFFISSCNEDIVEEKPITPQRVLDSLAMIDSINKYDVFPKINYRRVKLKNSDELYQFRKEYGRSTKNFSKWKIITTLNRQELYFIRVGETIVIPDTIIDDTRAYSCFPQYYWGGRNLPKLIIVDNHTQAYACYEYGRQIRFVATNTGKERTPTFPGRYAVEWKKIQHRSSLDSTWIMPYTINIHYEAGNAFHQFSMPGRAVSHSCCRQFMDDAEWLFYWARGFKTDSNKKRIPMSGTPVLILNTFDFARKEGAVWTDWNSNKDYLVELPPDPMAVEEALIPIIQIPEGARYRLKNRERYVHGEDTLRARGILREGVKLIASVNFNEQRRKKAFAEAKKKKLEDEKKINGGLQSLPSDNGNNADKNTDKIIIQSNTSKQRNNDSEYLKELKKLEEISNEKSKSQESTKPPR